jgi:hypothetical protein
MCPIFILPCGGRSGSTWIARLLTSSKEVLVWTETALLNYRFNYLNSVAWTYAEDTGKDTDLHFFRKHNTKMWAAALRPFEDDLNRHWAKMMDGVFQEAAEREGFKRWGLKEVSWQLDDVMFIRSQWTDYRIIFLVRNFLDCYRSSIGTGWLLGDTGRMWFIREWVRMANQISSFQIAEGKERIFKYEELNPEEFAKWCGVTEVKKMDYIGASSKIISAHDWKLIKSFSGAIDPLLEKLGYDKITYDNLYAVEKAAIPNP